MLHIPHSGQVSVITNGGLVGSASPWTGVTSGAGADVYGSVVELISAANNTQDSWGIEILAHDTGISGVASEAVVDILAGTATEDVLIDSLIVGYCNASAARRYFFPLFIPAGTRISARSSCLRSTAAIKVGLWLYGGNNPPFKVGRKVVTYGTKQDNSRGAAIVPTASGGAASVTELSAASSADHHYFMPGFSPDTDATITPYGWVNIGIGVGAATEERIGTWFFGKDTAENTSGPFPGLGAFRDVPSGTRLTMLASNSGANDSNYNGLIYAV